MAEVNLNKKEIAVYSVSSPLCFLFQQRVINTKKIFEQNGIDVIFDALIFAHDGSYSTGSVLNKAQEFNKLLVDHTVLMSSIGGFNSSSILPLINYEQIVKKHTKIIGLSDSTAILLAVYKMTNLPTYYGQSFLKDFDENDYLKNHNLQMLNSVVFNENYPVIIHQPAYYDDSFVDWNDPEYLQKRTLKLNQWKWINPKKITGRLIGGNLNTLISMLSTKYMPEIKKGDILLIEDSDKTIAECERSFATLKNAGILDLVSAVIVGKCENINQQSTNHTYEEVLSWFLPPNLTVLSKFDCGHTLPSCLVKIGGHLTLDPENNQVILLD